MRPVIKVEESRVIPKVETRKSCWKALVRAIATRRAHDSDFIRAIDSYNQAKRDAQNVVDDDKLDRAHDSSDYYRRAIPSNREARKSIVKVGEKLDYVSILAFSKGTWILAAAIGEASVRARDFGILDTYFYEISMNVDMNDLKSEIFGCSINFDFDYYFSNYTVLEKVRSCTEKLLEESEHVEPVELKSITQQPSPVAELSEAEVLSTASIYPHIRNEVSKIFKDWAEKLSGNTDPKFILGEAKFAYTAYPLKHLSVSNCMNRIRETGFIDGADPEKPYVYKCMKKLAKKYGYSYPKLLRYSYSGAMKLAEEIDNSGTLPYKVVDVVSFVSDVLDNVVSGLRIGTVYTPPQSMYDQLFEVVDDVVIKKDPELLPAVSAMLNELDMCILRELHQRLLAVKQARRLDMS